MNDRDYFLSLKESDSKLNLDNLELAEKIYSLATKKQISRTDFVKMINLDTYSEYISKVNYFFMKGEGLMDCRPNIFAEQFGLKKFKSRIVVFKNAFDDSIHQNFADFYSTLVFHEGFHAKDNYEGTNLNRPNSYDLFATELFDSEKELRAYTNQINNLHQENSSKYVAILRDRLEILSESVSELEKRL